MERTALTVGGFTQPSVAKALIELPASIEKGLTQRFLWICPKPSFATFDSLELIDNRFTEYLGEYMYMYTGCIVLCNCLCNIHRALIYSPNCTIETSTSCSWLTGVYMQ